MSFISPRVDIAFKKIFGVEENKDLLISLINAVVSEEDQISDVVLLNPYNAQSFKDDRLSILDIKATAVTGQLFNIEMQLTDDKDYEKRALYYWAKLYTEQIKSTYGYKRLCKTIGIHILNFHLLADVTKYHNVFRITEKDSGASYFDHLEIHTIELHKFHNDVYAPANIIKTALDRWTLFLTQNNLISLDNIPAYAVDKDIIKAINQLKIMSFNEEERSFYDDHLKWVMTEIGALEQAKEEGREEGREEGKAEGERRTKIEIAKNLLSQNLDIATIATATQLTEAEINQILLQKD
jgi:predicted transposase/invertase (TIGR01784 family)